MAWGLLYIRDSIETIGRGIGDMDKHTKGPWEFTDDDKQDCYLITGPGHCYIAAVDDLGGPSDNEANARLIAASPGLLAAAKVIQDKFYIKKQWISAVEMVPLVEAIAKAEGKKDKVKVYESKKL